MQVLDYDRFSRDDPIGEIAIPLADVDLATGQTMWKNLQPCKGHTVSTTMFIDPSAWREGLSSNWVKPWRSTVNPVNRPGPSFADCKINGYGVFEGFRLVGHLQLSSASQSEHLSTASQSGL